MIYLLIALTLFAVRYFDARKIESLTPQTAGFFVTNTQTKFTNCQANGMYPDKECTPGAIIAIATKEDICTPGYSKGVRDVPEKMKKDVYAEYSITHRTAGEYEVDHFISLELGGSNDLANLFPEAASPTPGFHEKDKVENYLHDEVCKGVISLNEAQRQIATDWYAVYATYIMR